jgi:hypothetical protein
MVISPEPIARLAVRRPDSALPPQQRDGVAGQSDPVQPDLLDKRVLRPNEFPPRRWCVLHELQVVACPGPNVGLEAR